MVDAVPAGDVDALVDEYGDLYEMDADLRPGGERHESVRHQARIEAALRTFLGAGGFGAFTTNFEDLGGLRQLPGLAVQRLMADGYGFGGEGDWKTSALLRVLKVVGAGLRGGTSFMEDYTYHLAGDRPKVPVAPRVIRLHAHRTPQGFMSGRPVPSSTSSPRQRPQPEFVSAARAAAHN